MSDSDERTLTISGVKVTFPCKPYPSQFGMMDKVIKGLERRQNGLLESPTGSGKSLALLCSALAWQVAQHERIIKENLASCSGAGDFVKPCHCGATDRGAVGTEYSPGSKPGFLGNQDEGNSDNPVNLCDDDDDNDFKPTSSKLRTPTLGKGGQKKRRHLGIQYEDETDNTVSSSPPTKCTCSETSKPDTKKKEKIKKCVNDIAGGLVYGRVPKIYFGTRTHKQIAQITRELRKTAYHDVRMVILASREYTCVHPEVTKLKNKSEGCRERLDKNGPGCKFNDKAKRVFTSQRLLQEELTTAWDLEDFVASCNTKKACPYFVTRNIVEGADIIFCPYNYLIDPLVRKSMDIQLKDQVVILDEAHNMEDCARDAASGSITTDQITKAIHNLQELMEHNIKFVEHLKLKNMLDSLLNFIEGKNSNLDQVDYDTSYKVWSGFDIVVRLKGIGLGPDSFQEYQRCFEQAIAQNDDEQISVRDRRNQEVKMASSTQQILELLFQILDYMYRHDLKFVEDYRVAIMKSMQYVSHRDTSDKWLGKNRRGGRIVVFTLNFWCMNPAVAFSDFGACRNVVLSSGTLSPMLSFASELGTPFPIQLEANHVIDDKQVWVGAIGTGPSGHQLQAVYRNMESFTFQDELGNFILQVCLKVPHGVLCFLPSYRALQKFTERWKLTGLWGKLRSRKRVMVEPRAVDREEFDGMMKAFYDVVKGDLYTDYMDEGDCGGDDSEIDGALFFAVCRGKVSEGMDFADNNARAVITIGIPYPSFKDVQVKLKREYNDKHKVDRGLLSGSEWYDIQAFRALNQALGRCIRHRKDWGALIIVDDRFVKKSAQYCKSLSRWVRSKVQTYEVFSDFLTSLSSFTDRMIKEMPTVSADTSFIPCTPGSVRRESFYRRESIDTSYMNISVQDSPYFSGTPMSQPGKSRKTPDSSKNDRKCSNSVLSSPAFTSPLQKQIFSPPSQQIISPSMQHNAGAAPSIEQQIMDVINSATAPKDQPYYIILNKGTPNEQAFLVEPNKLAGNNFGQLQIPGVHLPMLSAQNASTLTIPMMGTSQQQILLLPVQGTSLLQNGKQSNSLQHGGVSLLQNPATSLQQNGSSLLHNQTIKSNLVALGNKPQTLTTNIKTPEQKEKTAAQKTDMVFTLGTSSLPAEEQLKRFVNSGQAPRDQAYYVIVNKGTSSEKAFFIEPNKKGKPNPEVEKKQEHTNPEPATEVKQEVVVPDSSTEGDPEPQNKFLKFCHLPKTSAKVPVATVTPQRPASSEKDLSSKDTAGDDPDTTQHPSPSVVKPEQEVPRVTSPDLFDNSGQLQAVTAEPAKDHAVKKKPIFRKKVQHEEEGTVIGEHEKVVKPTLVTEVKESKDVGEKEKLDSDKVDKISDADSDFKPENVRSRSATRGKVNKSVAEKLKEYRRLSTDGDDKTGLKDKLDTSNVTAAEKQEMSETDDQSDEDFLNTRRRGGRKRKSTSRYEDWTKRTKKGGNPEEDGENVENKENNQTCTLSCAKCGKNWLKSLPYEKQKRKPEFLAGIVKKNMELYFFSKLKLESTALEPVSSETSVKGVTLNAEYDEEAGCCIQYLQCKFCDTNSVIGARIPIAEPTSKFHAGQTWILSSAAKL